ncbi:dynein light chain roadblock-type 2-like [Molossus molossus]|uniref:dynein light chain roadblock-type 2-like n=1 Tax=Molossus molossus TaxID=27622 RepID=UPI0017467F8A|nr:dynein light chain roadblock-type 2-like [Molossus molossus]
MVLKKVPNGLKTLSEVAETLMRTQSHKGVIRTVVVDAKGILIQTLDNSAIQCAGFLPQLTMPAKILRAPSPFSGADREHEIMVAPDKKHLLTGIRNPCEWLCYSHILPVTLG